MRLLSVAILAVLLSGCGYDHDDLVKARSACDSYNGTFKVITTGNLITNTKCKVDGVTYRMTRISQKLVEGYIE